MVAQLAHIFAEKREMEKKVTGFVARNENGELKLFRCIPIREPDIYEAYDNYGDGCMDYVFHPNTHWYDCGRGITLPIDMFPQLSWEDEPIEVEFTISARKW